MAALAAGPSNAVSLVDDFYLNRKLGLGFRKPDGWSFADVQEMGSVQQGQLLAIDDDVAAGEILESMDLPFVSVLRGEKASDGFAPSAQFFLSADIPALESLFDLGNELERLMVEFQSEEEPVEALPPTVKKLHDDAQACDECLKSFEILSQPRQFRLSACDAAEYSASYLFEHQKLAKPFRVRTKTIYVQHRVAPYLIRLVDRPQGEQKDEFDFDTFIDSIYLV